LEDDTLVVDRHEGVQRKGVAEPVRAANHGPFACDRALSARGLRTHEIDTAIDDPAAYTRPQLELTRTWGHLPGKAKEF